MKNINKNWVSLCFLLIGTWIISSHSEAFPLTCPAAGSTDKPFLESLTCEYADNPIGLDVKNPQLSWKIKSGLSNILQIAYEIRVGIDAQSVISGKKLIWKTGKVASNQSIHINYEGPELLARKRYYWQVRIWDNHGRTYPWSEVKFWEMGLLTPADWTAKWIQFPIETDGKTGPAPRFRKTFVVGKPVKSARLYITSHGIYDAQINGKRVSDEYFRPGWTSYKHRLQYQSYDITELLNSGKNAVGVTVGDGWYRGYMGFQDRRNLYGKEVALLCQMELVYTDGKTEIIDTDGTWKANITGPVRTSDIYNGERYDARLENSGWSKFSFNDADWPLAKVVEISKNNLVAPDGPPVRKQEVFKPLKIFKTPKGETVVDFGQNLVGWAQFKVNGKSGDSIVVQHAEVLDKEGNFYTANLRTAKQTNTYILKGGGEELFEPHFTYQGFRYIMLGAYPGTISADEIRAVVLYSDMNNTGSFSTSDTLLNQLQKNIQWGQKGNFVDIPSDCPQRDERLGWTGDAQVFFNTAAFNMDVAGFFKKWLKDLKADQHQNGNVPVVIPDVLSKDNAGSAGWSDASTIIPWNLYQLYGDKKVLEEQYSSMRKWVDYLDNVSVNSLVSTGDHYGDWLFYSPEDDTDGRAAITDKYLIAQAFYANSVQNLINTAEVLGKLEDVTSYTALLQRVKTAFVDEYLTKGGRLVSSSQTAYVLALNFDLLPVESRQKAAERLVRNVRSYGNHITTGFLGTPYLCHVLSRFGYTDVAYALLKQETYPSWLYPVKMGATTIWERWDGIKADGSFQNVGMNSFNHYAYGAIGDWMYRYISGINPESSGLAYKKIVISPKPGGGLTHARGELETLYGKLSSEWKIVKGTMRVQIVIPANTTARIILPGGGLGAIKGQKGDISSDKSLKTTRLEDDLEIQVGSGTYNYEYTYSPKP